jgi:hypothetical protein
MNCWMRSASIIATTTIQQPLQSGKRTEEALSFWVRLIASTQGFWPLNAWHETFGCQFTNAPLGFSFHAQTCSV